MPIHDWTRAKPGRFHHFHTAWMVHLADALNAGRLPDGYFALAEQKTDTFGPDVVALSTDSVPLSGTGSDTVAVAEPQTERRVTLGTDPIPSRRLAIRHAAGDRLVAVIEIVSRRNKDRPSTVGEFAGKVVDFLLSGVHVAVVDVFPPSKHDPGGMHPVICELLDPTAHGDTPPPGRPLTCAGYQATRPPIAYLNYAAVGQPLPGVPLYLDAGVYADLPLEETYTDAFDCLPAVIKGELRIG
ncbi:MAG: DUF4058 family protein [Bacteroidales bacterium]|nr:DUF4058 family protein [Bacteroidales bacterium]